MEEHPGADNPTRFEAQILKELKNLREDLLSAQSLAAEANERSLEQNRSIIDHERTLYGHEDSRRRMSEPGVVQVVGELATAFRDVKAVAKAGWAMLGLFGVSLSISLFTFFQGLG